MVLWGNKQPVRRYYRKLTTENLEIIVDALENYLREGDWVEVTTGPFQGIKGILKELRGETRVVINVEGIYQSASFVIDKSLVERIDKEQISQV